MDNKENFKLLFQSGVLSVYEVNGKIWPNECDLDGDPVKYVIKLKNVKYGYDKRINLCEKHFNEIKESLFSYCNN